MNIDTLKLHLQKHVQLKELYLTGDKNYIHIIAVGEIFNHLTNLERQKIIYQPLTCYIIKKKIHAITIDTFTPEEWYKSKKNKKNDTTNI
ncbi:BolA/IbaG family iron-sulfur metabolism protein [Buchnera aphidicola]|uniref:BolA/IbaG family iron-sulfur metabolism protein n=1 Tax=Buchnera aphidicola (Sarucallis kahawaluokalani) TaxID=1241878 RepID=A0A4D6Y9I4_9GAMM|nr:BolA/IbaG family iron-sulfur metabolism protein [Buchnera aphidicola]QCI26049.1 BolA/IbaG family iron-sulfur metabolism protein [Buchnera aphidicola (Sarucallis kahawaluokalani)]